ncbi:GNAT family N-acetyltransferase [Cognatilysobacter lacus]|uniref:GNAT family N-acetyltransferase n=1 Tax=Cognatilysobacter lacus TaxID=1643323 RepID=A0A5D8Z747_9GAMM|nr:GNAT family N-acetyltransferase [Lysobacter lacus]TZF90708.1 GNAT family N-acetyltransferase [Lysobacter lacus]
MNADALCLAADWLYGQTGEQRHYLVRASLRGESIGQAHGWFEPGGRFVVEKVEIATAHRSRGHGSALIDALRAQARERGCTAFVFKGVRAANSGAIRLYEAMGAEGVPASDGLLDFVISPP